MNGPSRAVLLDKTTTVHGPDSPLDDGLPGLPFALPADVMGGPSGSPRLIGAIGLGRGLAAQVRDVDRQDGSLARLAGTAE